MKISFVSDTPKLFFLEINSIKAVKDINPYCEVQVENQIYKVIASAFFTEKRLKAIEKIMEIKMSASYQSDPSEELDSLFELLIQPHSKKEDDLKAFKNIYFTDQEISYYQRLCYHNTSISTEEGKVNNLIASIKEKISLENAIDVPKESHKSSSLKI
jgi:hypothetical protein